MAHTTAYQRQERLLTLDNLGLSYGSKTIFRNINLSIDNIVRPGMEQGQVVSLLGPSGIGKTQLMRCIAGLRTPTQGHVGLNGTRSTVAAGEVGLVFQNYPLLEHRTVWGNLALAAGQANKTGDDICKLLEMFKLADKKHLYPAQLSGGQRQRIAIIQQMLCSSHFILMDEPFSGLDVVMKQKTLDLVREVSTVDELNTLIISTHDIGTAIAISDTLWVLGREKAADGSWVAGSTCVRSYDLIERGLAWNKDVEKHPEFYPLLLEIKDLFSQL